MKKADLHLFKYEEIPLGEHRKGIIAADLHEQRCIGSCMLTSELFTSCGKYVKGSNEGLG